MSDINFLPASYVQQKSRQRREVRQWLLVGAVASALVVLGVMDRARLASLESHVEDRRADIAQAEQLLDDLKQLEAEEQDLGSRVVLMRELATPVNVSDIIATMTALLPPGTGALNLSARNEAPRIDAVSRKPKNGEAPPHQIVVIEMVGVSANDEAIANLVGDLSKHGLFEHVSLLYSRARPMGRYVGREFRIETTIRLDRAYERRPMNQEVAYAQ